MEVWHYLSVQGVDPFQDWLDQLKDLKARVAILRRIDRFERGSSGDHKFCRDGVWELRIDFGPGYRIYYAQHGKVALLLLCGGSKRTQTSDIEKAVDYWRDFQQRTYDS